MSYQATQALLAEVAAEKSTGGYAVDYWLIDATTTPNLVRGDADVKRLYRSTVAAEDVAGVPADGSNETTCHVPCFVTHESGITSVSWETVAAVSAMNKTAMRAWMTTAKATCQQRVNGAG